MNDTDKILHALAELTKKVDQQGNAIAGLQDGQNRLEAGQQGMQKDIRSLQDGQKTLEQGQNTLELKFEAFHEEQKRANSEIITTLNDVISIDAKETDKRLTRIEKHLDLPPIK